MKQKSYLKAVVIVHGKSEKQLCQFIRLNLRLKIEIQSDKNGEKSIQINSLLKILNNSIYRTFRVFKSHFVDDIEIDPKTKNIPSYFKIFTIMDTDDCTEEMRERYKSKALFKDHWAYEYITPIWNSPDLEKVLEKSGIKYKKNGKAKKSEYIEIFPTDQKYLNKTDVIQIEELCNNLKKNSDTNMNEFLEFCLKQSK